MKHIRFITFVIMSLVFAVAANGQTQSEKKDSKKQEKKLSNNPKVKITTNYGTMIMVLRADVAPLHAENFLKLVGEKFYDGTTFHRVIPRFMIQGGDPNSRSENRMTHGTGGPGYTIPAEINLPNKRGSVAAARQGDQVNPRRESSGSQFYINVVDNKFLDNQYTVFGEIVEGMDVADKIAAVQCDQRDNPVQKIEMTVTLVKE